MELELQRSCLNGYQMVLNRTIVQEETLEGIVPDACPDMARIIGTSGQIIWKTNELSSGSLRMNGVIRMCILYMPDGEEGPRHVDVVLPFGYSVDDPNLHSACKLHIAPRLCSADAHLLNPRKYLARAELAIEVQAYTPMEKCICTGVSDVDGVSEIQQRSVTKECYYVTSLSEKSFNFSEVLDFPSNRAHVKELLQSVALIHNAEAKVIGGKLILKGEAELNTLCRSEDGTIFSEIFSVPYSQILELNGVGEECDTKVTCYLTDLECALQAGGASAVAVSLELTAQAVVGETRSIQMLTDLYSTSCLLEPEFDELSIEQMGNREHMRESVRHFCECGIPAKNVVDINICFGRLTHTQENGMYQLTAECTAAVLFYSEDDALCSASYVIPVSCSLPVSEGHELLFTTEFTGKPSALSVYGGFEVRFEVDFACRIHGTHRCSYVGGVRIMPATEKNEHIPSLIIRMPEEKEELWDLAKAYNSTVGDIMTVNKLESEHMPAGQMLLIPRCR